MYLFDNIGDFFDSTIWKGQFYYTSKPYRKWFSWIYVAIYDEFGIDVYKESNDVQIKIGHTSDITQRIESLHRSTDSDGKKQKPASILYAWSVPKSIKFENDLKHLLRSFIAGDTLPNRAGASEIVIGIPIVPLINMVQLSILNTCIQERYINTDMEFILRPPDMITDMGEVYEGATRFAVPHNLDLNQKFIELEPSIRNIRYRGDPIEAFKEKLFRHAKRPTPKPKPKPTELRGEYSKTAENMKGKVFPIGSYIYARYESQYFPARVVGYGKEAYAIMWLKDDDGYPVIPLQDTKDDFHWVKDVTTIRGVYALTKEQGEIYSMFALSSAKVPKDDIVELRL